MPEEPLRLARQLRVKLEGYDANTLTSENLTNIGSDLATLSQAISKRFFLQDDQSPGKAPVRLLA